MNVNTEYTIETTTNPKSALAIRKKRRPQVRWETEETEAIVSLMVELRANEPIESALYLLQKAQKVLPDDRQRPIATLQSVPELTKKFNLAWKEAQKNVEKPNPVSIEVLASSQPVDSQKSLADIPLLKLAEALFVGLTGTVKAPLPAPPSRETAVALHPYVPAAASNQQPVKSSQKRIAIVGLLRHQFEQVKKRVNGKADLRFIDKDQSRPDFPTVDYIVVHKHTGHRWFNAAQNLCPSKNIMFDGGGITKTTKMIYDLISRQEKR